MNIAGIAAIGLEPGARHWSVAGVISQNLMTGVLVFAGLTMLYVAWRLCLQPHAHAYASKYTSSRR
jgi:hypothetical protein